MKIVIPTYMREDRQKCWESMPLFVREKTHLMSHSGRADLLRKNYPDANVEDMGVTHGIADVRQKALDFFPDEEKVVMLDDNCTFVQLDRDKMKYVPMDDSAWRRWLDFFETSLDEYAQVSTIDRGLAGFLKEKPGVANSRIYSVNGMNRRMLKEAGADFDTLWRKDNSVYLGEDFYLTLKLLTEGFPNWKTSDFAFTHPHGKKGGNSVSRTGEMERRSFELLQEEFPGLVSYWKDYDASWSAGTDENGSYRWRCTIKWAQAYKRGLQKVDRLILDSAKA